MKKMLAIIFAVLMALSVVTVAFAATPADLTYSVEGEAVTITGCRREAEGTLAIPETIEGKPVTKIAPFAFRNADNITEIYISKNIETIGEYAFTGCDDLKVITVSKDNAVYTATDGILYSKDKTVLVCYPADKNAKTFVVPDGVVTIEAGALSDADDIYAVLLPVSLKKIGEGAFNECDDLTDVYYKGSTKEVGSIDIGGGNGYLVNAVWHYNATSIPPRETFFTRMINAMKAFFKTLIRIIFFYVPMPI